MKNSTLDASIPVLTEVIEPLQIIEERLYTQPRVFSSVQEKKENALKDATNLNSNEWPTLEPQFKERILQQILAQIDGSLEQHVRNSLADALQTAVEGLTRQIRHNLHHTLETALACTSAQETMRPQTIKK